MSRSNGSTNLDPAVNRCQLGREHEAGRPRFHQATIVAKIEATIAATPCAVLIRSIMPADPRQLEMRANARVKGGNSGGAIINKKGYAVGILVSVPLDPQDTTRVDELGYGIAVPKQAFLPLLSTEAERSPLITALPFTNLVGGGFSTLSA